MLKFEFECRHHLINFGGRETRSPSPPWISGRPLRSGCPRGGPPWRRILQSRRRRRGWRKEGAGSWGWSGKTTASSQPSRSLWKRKVWIIFDFIVFIVRIIWESVVVQVQARLGARWEARKCNFRNFPNWEQKREEGMEIKRRRKFFLLSSFPFFCGLGEQKKKLPPLLSFWWGNWGGEEVNMKEVGPKL